MPAPATGTPEGTADGGSTDPAEQRVALPGQRPPPPPPGAGAAPGGLLAVRGRSGSSRLPAGSACTELGPLRRLLCRAGARAVRRLGPRGRMDAVGLATTMTFSFVLFLLETSPVIDVKAMGVASLSPLLTALVARARATAVSGVFVVVLILLTGVLLDGPTFEPTQVLRLLIATAATVVAVSAASVRSAQHRRLVAASVLADVVRSTALRPVPGRVGHLDVASYYAAADTGSRIGGDFFDVLDTPFGVRAIMGDARGHGLGAVSEAVHVLGAFREAAYESPDLRHLAARMDASLARHHQSRSVSARALAGGTAADGGGPGAPAEGDLAALEAEDYATACLVEVDGLSLRVASCGHPPPVLLCPAADVENPAPGSWDTASDGPWAYRVSTVDVVPDVPLSLGSAPEVLTTTVPAGTRVLLHTDGLSEARRGGDFYDVAGAAAQFLTAPDMRAALGRLEADVRRWSDRHAWDDLALLSLHVHGGGAVAASPDA